MTISYSANALVYKSAAGTWSLRPDYNHAVHRVEVVFTDDDDFLHGDHWAIGTGNDKTQSAIITDMLGNPVASGQIYDEEYYEVSTGGGPAIKIHIVEIADRVVGYVLDTPLEPGTTYDLLATSNVTSTNLIAYSTLVDVPCFGPGTLISTLDGDLPVEWLAPGDPVITRDHGAQPLRWIGRCHIPADRIATHPGLRPVLIAPHSFGPDMPEAPLALSPQHRIFLDGPEVQLYLGTETALAAAKHLSSRTARCDPVQDYVYYHLLFDDHQVIRSNGLWTESLFLGEMVQELPLGSRRGMPQDIRHDQTAHRCLTGWEAQFLMRIRGGLAERPAQRAA